MHTAFLELQHEWSLVRNIGGDLQPFNWPEIDERGLRHLTEEMHWGNVPYVDFHGDLDACVRQAPTDVSVVTDARVSKRFNP